MRKLIIFVGVVAMLMSCGCWRKYEVPEYSEISTSETAFLVPLEDAMGKQVKLASEEAYKKLQVSTKRLRITKRWNKTGRLWYTGEWIPTVRVIKVNRAPVTRQWTADAASGTANKDQAIWAESSDSVGYSVGFNCTTYIAESDAAKFLYWYPSGSLAGVMDTEIRTRIQQVVAEVSSKYNMDVLREKKMEIIAAVRTDVIPFFEPRGITVTAIGLFGGFEYENVDIQKSIDAVFVAQQEKAREKALLEAMDSKKQRMNEEGTALANKMREEAKGRADSVLLRKEAEAAGIKLVNAALEEAKTNPLFIQIKALEVEAQRITKWSGSVPQMIMGGDGNGFVPMIQIPGKGGLALAN